MKKVIISFGMIVLLCGCHSNSAPTEYVEYADNVEYIVTTDDTPVAPGTSQIKYSVPNNSDLTLETRHHVIQIQGNPQQPYAYYVWAGDKSYNDDPDLIVDDGNIMVLGGDQ